MVDTSQSNAASYPIWGGLVDANQLVNYCVKSLEESQWLVEGKLSKNNTNKFLEFLFYMCHVSEKRSRGALSLSFKPEYKGVDFISDLETKLFEKDN